MGQYVSFYNSIQELEKLKELLPYSVVISVHTRPHQEYFEWCRDNCEGWWGDLPTVSAYTNQNPNNWVFYFEELQDALMFKLTVA
jgi:hypothetical protein